MRATILLALWLVALCSVCRSDVTMTRLEPFETGDQPHWKVDTTRGDAVYIPPKNSLETPTLLLDRAAVDDSSITITIESDAKLLRLKGHDNIEFDTKSAKQHTLFLSFKKGDSTLYFDGRESAPNKGSFLATLADNAEKIPLAFVGASYITIQYQIGTRPPGSTPAAPAIASAATKPAATGATASIPATGKPFVMKGNGTKNADGAMVLTGNQRLTSVDSFKPPVTFKITAQTNSTNIRIAYAASDIIFNWEVDPTQLRIDGGPAGGQHKKGAGQIPINQWVVIDLIVLPDSMAIAVDGQERYRVNADFSRIDQPLNIFPANHSTIQVKSVTLQAGKVAPIQTATFEAQGPIGLPPRQSRVQAPPAQQTVKKAVQGNSPAVATDVKSALQALANAKSACDNLKPQLLAAVHDSAEYQQALATLNSAKQDLARAQAKGSQVEVAALATKVLAGENLLTKIEQPALDASPQWKAASDNLLAANKSLQAFEQAQARLQQETTERALEQQEAAHQQQWEDALAQARMQPSAPDPGPENDVDPYTGQVVTQADRDRQAYQQQQDDQKQRDDAYAQQEQQRIDYDRQRQEEEARQKQQIDDINAYMSSH